MQILCPRNSYGYEVLPPMNSSDESNRAKPNSISKHLPRPGRGPNGAGALVLKRSRGLVCRVAGCPVDCPGGSEMGGAKMSAASKSFAGDWWDREGYGGVTQEQGNTALFCFLLCNSTLGTQKEKKNFFLLLINHYKKKKKTQKTKQNKKDTDPGSGQNIGSWWLIQWRTLKVKSNLLVHTFVSVWPPYQLKAGSWQWKDNYKWVA